MPTVQQIVDYFNNNDMPEYAEKVVSLEDRSNELSALEYAGVDNWSGYYYKSEMLKENFPETYERMYD
jgi:EAL domain-containing protein (putative c-di-GMP-specific phosphodiesterase class I)